MSDNAGQCTNDRIVAEPERRLLEGERALKNFRYVVASIDESALKVWADLWRELQAGVTPGGMVTPSLEKGFVPSCGWPEFLEKFWMLKHYLDSIHRFATEG